jgi:hypothetical protein
VALVAILEISGIVSERGRHEKQDIEEMAAIELAESVRPTIDEHLASMIETTPEMI